MSEYRLRQGHHEKRNLWQHHINEPPASKSGECAGQVFDPDLATEICMTVNAAREAEHHRAASDINAQHAAGRERVGEHLFRRLRNALWLDGRLPDPAVCAIALADVLPVVADALTELEQARADLASAKSFAWTANGSLVRVTRVSDTSDGWVVDLEDQTVATGLDRESALARARELTQERPAEGDCPHDGDLMGHKELDRHARTKTDDEWS